MSKAHSLIRLTNKLVATPQMMEAQYFEKIASLLEDRNAGEIQLALENKAKSETRELIYNSDTKVGIVELKGPLTYLHYQPMCGESPTSYQSMLADVESLISSGAKTIVFDTDSPGGEAYGVFESAKRIRTMADEAGVKVITYVDGMAASAAYALASISDEIIMNPSAEVGSIGVVVRLRNTNKAMKTMGVEDTYVFAGKSKIPFNAEGDFAEEFLSDLQEKVNVLYGEFTSHVAQMRGMTPEAVTNTEAKTFLADKAIQLGLADKAMEVEEFYSYLSTVASGETDSKMLTARFLNKSKQGDTAKMQELVELQAAFAALTDEKTQMEAQLTQAVEAMTAAQAEATSIKEQMAQFQAEAESARLEAEAVAAQAKLDARQARLEASVGKEEAEALMASLGSLEDAAFDTVAGSFEKKAKAVEATVLFTELGVGDQGDEEALSDTAKILKAQLNKAKS